MIRRGGSLHSPVNRGTVIGLAQPRANPQDQVTWHDGVHICDTAIWCDALRTRDVCFVSCAHAIPGSRHGQLVATAATLAMLGETAGDTRLAVPYGRPFTLGTVRLELIRSGHGLGSAGLLVDLDGRRVLYASAVNPGGGGLGGAADNRPCDTLVLAADYGDPRFRFPDRDGIIDQVADFVLDVTTASGAAILLVSSPSKALDVASRLADRMPARMVERSGTQPSATPGSRGLLSFFGHRQIYDAALRARQVIDPTPRIRRLTTATPPAGHVTLWPLSRRGALPDDSPPGSRVALLSGLALDRDAVTDLRVSAAFPWSNQADCQQLIDYIEGCGASRVFLTHRHADTLAAALDKPGRVTRSLGPPRQMSLF